MSRTRVLIVDDSVVIRRMIADALAGDPSIEVVGTAVNGRLALQKIAQVNPDLVTMDVEMPELDGVSTVRELRKTWRKLPVIMFSTLTSRGASATLDALAAGASDYVTKPANVGGIAQGIEKIRGELIPKIKSLCPSSPAKQIVTAPPRRMVTATRAGAPLDVVVIGVSTGGPNTLMQVVPLLPATLDVPVLIVQHMPPVFTKLLAERMDSKSSLRVVEASHGETLVKGRIYLAPGDFHVMIDWRARRVELNQDPPENSCRPAADVLFRSAATQCGAAVLGVVLTGMGADGTRGARAIKETGGQVIVQDEPSSVVWGMPGSVVAAGLSDGQYTANEIAGEIAERVKRSRSIRAA